MTTKQVADRLIELCRMGKIEEAQQELYAEDAVSKEPFSPVPEMREVKGLTAIGEKGKHFQSMVEEFYGQEISEPVVAGNFFSIAWTMDVKMKGMDRMPMTEICLYHVKNGKVVMEEFFFDMM